MKPLFQTAQKDWSDFEKRAFNAVQEICERHNGDAEARYGAWEAMIWFSCQPEIVNKNEYEQSG